MKHLAIIYVSVRIVGNSSTLDSIVNPFSFIYPTIPKVKRSLTMSFPMDPRTLDNIRIKLQSNQIKIPHIFHRSDMLDSPCHASGHQESVQYTAFPLQRCVPTNDFDNLFDKIDGS